MLRAGRCTSGVLPNGWKLTVKRGSRISRVGDANMIGAVGRIAAVWASFKRVTQRAAAVGVGFRAAHGERGDAAGQLQCAVIIAIAAAATDMDTTVHRAKDIGKVGKVAEIAVDVDIEITAIFAKT